MHVFVICITNKIKHAYMWWPFIPLEHHSLCYRW